MLDVPPYFWIVKVIKNLVILWWLMELQQGSGERKRCALRLLIMPVGYYTIVEDVFLCLPFQGKIFFFFLWQASVLMVSLVS